jgi:hypothetical protein
MRRSNNKLLFIVLIVLVAGFVLTRVFRAPSRERNIEETLLKLDTSKVSAVHIFPAVQNGTKITLIRSGNKWEVEGDKRRGYPEMAQVRNALGLLTAIQADRVLTRNKENWSTYHIDTTGTHVKVLLGDDGLKEFWVGKMNSGGSSLRIEGEDDVYAADATLDRTFNRNFNDWRDKVFIKVQPEKISRITFQYPGDSSFVLNRTGNKWAVDNSAADSSKVQTYLNRFRSRSLSDFADDFTASGQPSYTVLLNRDSEDIIKIQGWKIEEDRWVLNSSQQKDVYFSSADASLIRDIFVGKDLFLSK